MFDETGQPIEANIRFAEEALRQRIAEECREEAGRRLKKSVERKIKEWRAGKARRSAGVSQPQGRGSGWVCLGVFG